VSPQNSTDPPHRATWKLGQDISTTRYVACWSEGNLLHPCGHQHKTLPESAACIHGADGSVKAFTDGRERPLTTWENEALIRALLELYGRAKKFSREDPLTGALIRRGFMEALEYECSRLRRCMLPLTLISLDLDDVKRVNDHSSGDLVLKVVGWTIQSTLCEKDSFARLRGDSFALLLPETGADNTRVRVANLQEALNAALKTYQWDITFSIVAVTFETPPATPDDMIEVAERHMRLVKEKGKNDVSYLTWSEKNNA